MRQKVMHSTPAAFCAFISAFPLFASAGSDLVGGVQPSPRSYRCAFSSWEQSRPGCRLKFVSCESKLARWKRLRRT